jgi:hypothetical protein
MMDQCPSPAVLGMGYAADSPEPYAARYASTMNYAGESLA